MLNFGTGIFGGLLEAVGNCSVLIFVPIQSSLSLEIQSIPPPSSPGTTVYLISQNVTFLEKVDKIVPEKSPIIIQVLQ